MNGAKQRSSFVVDTYTRCCLTAIAVLLAVLVVGLWAGAPVASSAWAAGSNTEAGGSFGNSIAQRQSMIRELTDANRKLSEIVELLKSGKVKVVMEKTEVQRETSKPKPPSRK